MPEEPALLLVELPCEDAIVIEDGLKMVSWYMVILIGENFKGGRNVFTSCIYINVRINSLY